MTLVLTYREENVLFINLYYNIINNKIIIIIIIKICIYFNLEESKGKKNGSINNSMYIIID